MGIDLKPIRWLGTTRDDIREQRRAVRNEFGQQLFRAQMGLMPKQLQIHAHSRTECVRDTSPGRRWHCSADVRGQVPRHDLRPSRVHKEVAENNEDRYRYRQEALPGGKRWLTACSTTSLTLQRRRQTSP